MTWVTVDLSKAVFTHDQCRFSSILMGSTLAWVYLNRIGFTLVKFQTGSLSQVSPFGTGSFRSRINARFICPNFVPLKKCIRSGVNVVSSASRCHCDCK